MRKLFRFFTAVMLTLCSLSLVSAQDLSVGNTSAEPTAILAETPKAEPATEPTEALTEEPTVEPTEIPTEEPTAELTDILTEEPTTKPTDVPTEEPTAELTGVSTETPTVEPTDPSAEELTTELTETPTEEPTTGPTEIPTEEPTAEPTEIPTDETTAEPAETPTAEPTEVPTEEAAAEPTDVPTEEPTAEVMTETPAADVIVTITGAVSRVTYSGQKQSVSGFTVSANHPDYDVTTDLLFRRDAEPVAERTDVGITWLGLTKDDFINVDPAFGHVEFDVTDGYIEILPVSVVVEIEGNSGTVLYDEEPHTAEGYTVKSVSCTFSVPDQPEFTIYDCQSYTPEDFVFTGTALAERIEPGITYMGLTPELFENRNVNFDTVTFIVTDGFQEILSPEETPAPEAETERNVTIHSSLKTHVYTNDEIVLSAHLEGFGACEELRYQWECDQGEGFLPVEGGDKATLTYPANAETLSWKWQLTVFCK